MAAVTASFSASAEAARPPTATTSQPEVRPCSKAGPPQTTEVIRLALFIMKPRE
ncbi:hypothetical protein D3C72_1813130 [compost metagenome]